MKATEFDDKFERGEDITDFLDISQAKRPGLEQKRVNVDFPAWMIEALDHEARQLLRYGLQKDLHNYLVDATKWLRRF